jgi:2-oxoglutarate/2-oxoacid ferredoxin oxidoreductase subunit alpha
MKMTERKFMQGSHALAEAAIRAGCRFYAGYPITPATEIHEYMTVHMPAAGGVAMAGATEIEGIVMVAGAVAAGVPAMIASSSTGISLMQEQIAEIANAGLPAVVVNACRGTLQADYHQSVKGGGHGDYRTVVLAPSTTQEMVDFTQLAFEIAWHYRHPVLILADTLLVHCSETVDLREHYVDVGDISSWAVTGGRDGAPRHTITHQGEDPTTNRVDSSVGRRNCLARMAAIQASEVRFEAWELADADVVVAYGSVASYARMAITDLRAKGLRVGLFRPITLWPFPDEALARVASAAKSVVVVEVNAGQMVEDVRAAVAGRCPVHGLAGDGDQDTGFGDVWSKAAIQRSIEAVSNKAQREKEATLA